MQGVYLWLSGEVLPCHRMEPPGHPWPVKIFGNVRKEALLDIWHRPEYRKFRSRVLKGDQPDVCLGCTFNDSVTI
jgi:radical SAM protein with 4Fe4S-binding SPASM domain